MSMTFAEMMRLEPHGPDVMVGHGPSYPWGGLYGGQIVAQALMAAASSVDPAFAVHSLRAYFIRLGDASEPIRFEIDRIRNGRSFCTRRVVARQATGAILNLEASFHAGAEGGATRSAVADPTRPDPEGLVDDSWSPMFERRWARTRGSEGRAQCWFRLDEPIGDSPLLHAAALAYVSDDLPTDAVVGALGRTGPPDDESFESEWFSASLDHTIWFHRPVSADGWHLQDLTCHAVVDGRGLAIGHAFAPDGTHLATIAQEVLLRRRRPR